MFQTASASRANRGSCIRRNKKTGQKIATSVYDTFVSTHDEQILKGNKPLAPFFENFSLSRYREEDLGFIKHCMAGPEAINATGKKFLKLTFASAGVSRLPRYDFHAHAYGNKNPAWYLNTTFAKHASVFVNSYDLAPACLEPDFKGKVIFRMPQPVRWNGMPYSFALFTAGFHPQGNAVHSSYAALNGSPAEDRAVQICIFS